MKQETFIKLHQAQWQALHDWLQQRGQLTHWQRRKKSDWQGLPDADVPAAYRQLCQHLSLARRRGYSPRLQRYLQDLMQQGHSLLYRARSLDWRALPRFFSSDFPRLVRAEWRCMLASALLLFVPLIGVIIALQIQPALVHSMMSPTELAELETMYRVGSEGRIGRSSGSDIMMLGYYILNNIGIGLRTFALGLLAGFGSIFILVFNGIKIGATLGHLQQVGLGEQIYSFVAGHSALELGGIVLAGGAGLQLGLRMLLPGNRRRIDAVIEGGRRGGLLCLGVFLMLLGAAVIEAFWSSLLWVPALLKYAVGVLLWLLLLLWLWRGGRVDGPWQGGRDAA